MPGLRLQLEQARRLFGVSADTCAVVLEDLVAAGALRRAADGQYCMGDGEAAVGAAAVPAFSARGARLTRAAR